jgi:hypothetical protein
LNPVYHWILSVYLPGGEDAASYGENRRAEKEPRVVVAEFSNYPETLVLVHIPFVEL